MNHRRQTLKNAIVHEALAFRDNPTDTTSLFATVDALLEYERTRISISDHALSQFLVRAKAKSPDRARRTLQRMCERAVSIELKDRWRVVQLLNHRLEDADYYTASGWILVVVNGVLKTVHQGEAKRWCAKSKDVSKGAIL